jgi:hypothetical protein
MYKTLIKGLKQWRYGNMAAIKNNPSGEEN